MEYTTNAPKGAELLDRVKPGWAGKMNLETFNIRLPATCVAGQVFKGELSPDNPFASSYRVGIDKLCAASGFIGAWWEFPREFGFDASSPETLDALQEEWPHLIRERLTA